MSTPTRPPSTKRSCRLRLRPLTSESWQAFSRMMNQLYGSALVIPYAPGHKHADCLKADPGPGRDATAASVHRPRRVLKRLVLLAHWANHVAVRLAIGAVIEVNLGPLTWVGDLRRTRRPPGR
jgi:hypothetical protein